MIRDGREVILLAGNRTGNPWDLKCAFEDHFAAVVPADVLPAKPPIQPVRGGSMVGAKPRHGKPFVPQVAAGKVRKRCFNPLACGAGSTNRAQIDPSRSSLAENPAIWPPTEVGQDWAAFVWQGLILVARPSAVMRRVPSGVLALHWKFKQESGQFFAEATVCLNFSPWKCCSRHRFCAFA